MPEAETGGQVGGEAGISGQKLVAQSVENQPVYATETGYHNATACNGGGHNPTSEAAAGIYGPRLSLEYHRLGVVKGFFYELRNERSETALCDREQHFGLTRYDGSRKPIFNALKNTLAAFSDPGPRAPNRQVSFTLDGKPANLRMMAFTRSNGGTQLALWRAQSVWDPLNKVTLADTKATFRITLPAATTVSTLNLVTGARVDFGTRSVFDLTVGAEALVVNLGPSSGNPPPAYTVDVGASTEPASYYTGSLGTHTNTVTTLPAAIRTTRYGPNLTYTLPTGGYAANVTVRYIEPTFTAAGRRVFDVTSDGRLLEDNLDLFVAGGNQRNVVIERTYRLIPGPDGAVHLTGTSSVDNAIYAEIVVTPVL
jgi:Malectin domain